MHPGRKWIEGDRDSAPSIWLEKRAFLLRWVGIINVTPAVLILALDPIHRALLLLIIGFAVLYLRGRAVAPSALAPPHHFDRHRL